MNQHGLRPLPKDTRDFKLGAVFDLPKLSDLPETFELAPLAIKNQGPTDYCTAYASCGASELQEGVELCPEYSFALGKELSGDPDAWGQDLRQAMRAHVKFGAVEEPQNRPADPRWLSDWPPELKDKALIHAKSSFMAVDGPYDHFDNIRAAMARFAPEKRGVVFGVQFGWPLSQVVMENPAGGSGHAMYCIGWRRMSGEPYLIVVNSYGEEAGVKGLHYFSRQVINSFVDQYGAFMFVDMTPEEYRNRLMPAWQRAFISILQGFRDVLKSLVNREPTDPIPEPVEPVHMSRIEAWADAIEAEESSKPPKDTDRNARNNNPGNLKKSDLVMTLGSLIGLGGYVGVDKDGFARFDSRQSGKRALVQFLTLAAQDQLAPYHQSRTIRTFTKTFAQPPNDSYGNNVANALGVTPDTDISTLL